ncbi:MAG: hypothetical protein MUF07_13285 [Steroidobacteraceae bacterium]|jgi:hypothetical protein|nr:hypothetical protein [Steroidobacteraceae bacterium]
MTTTTGTIWRTIPAGAIDALLRGRIEVAIRLVREAEQIGFRDAKRIVERYICSDPTLLECWAARRDRARRVLGWWVRGLAVTMVSACAFWLA